MDQESLQVEEFDYLFKIVIIGDSGVGKTNLLNKYISNEFNNNSKPTIGVEFATKNLQIENHHIKCQIWDTAGQERYRSITSCYYKGSIGAIIVFDITKQQTFEHVKNWHQELLEYADSNIVVALVGNKSDQQSGRAVRSEEAQDFAKTNQLFYVETSALDGSNVDIAFLKLIEKIYKQVKLDEPQREKASIKIQESQKLEFQKDEKKEKKDCC